MADLRVMSFNVRGARAADGLNEWRFRAALNVETIQRYHPDLIGFQEHQHGNFETYKSLLSGYEWQLGPGYSSQSNPEHNACYWRPQRLKHLESGGFYLSKTPAVFSGDWNTACIRCAAWSRFELPASRIQFIHLNTHLDHVSELARVEGSKIIVKELSHIAKDSTPVLITGDFNCEPGSDAYRVFTASGFVDTFLETGNRDGPEAATFHEFGGPACTDGGRIDWILTRHGRQTITIKSHAIIRDAHPPVYPSDHYPIITDLHLG